MDKPDFGGIANRLLSGGRLPNISGPGGRPKTRAQEKKWRREMAKHRDAIPPRPPKPMKNKYRFDAQRGCTVKDDGATSA